MTEFDELVTKLQKLKPDLTLIDIGKKIEQKKQKVGAGYLTDQGALFLIASDLGISLSAQIEKNPNEKSEIQNKLPEKKSTSNKPQTTKQDLERKFKLIESIKNKSSLHNKSAGILILFALVWIIVSTVLQFDIIPLEFQIIGLIVAPIGIAIGLLKRAGKFSLTLKQDFFFMTYRINVDVQTFLDLGTEQSKKKAINSVLNLSHQIGWPHFGSVIFDDTPYQIHVGLHSRIVPLIEERKIKDIEKFNAVLYDLIGSIESEGVTKEPFIQFKNSLEKFPKVTKTKPIKESYSFLQKYPQLKFAWIAPIVGAILFYVFYNIDTNQLHASLGYSLTISSGLLIAILTLVKRKSFDREKL